MGMKGGGGGGCEGLAKGTVKRKDLAEKSCKNEPKNTSKSQKLEGQDLPLMNADRRGSDKSQELIADFRLRAKGLIAKRQLLKIALGQQKHYCSQRCEHGQEVSRDSVAGVRRGREVLRAGDDDSRRHRLRGSQSESDHFCRPLSGEQCLEKRPERSASHDVEHALMRGIAERCGHQRQLNPLRFPHRFRALSALEDTDQSQ